MKKIEGWAVVKEIRGNVFAAYPLLETARENCLKGYKIVPCTITY